MNSPNCLNEEPVVEVLSDAGAELEQNQPESCELPTNNSKEQEHKNESISTKSRKKYIIKQVVLWSVFLSLAYFLISSFLKNDIDTIKGSNFSQYSTEKTIGTSFDSFFDNPKWVQEKTPNGKFIVFSGNTAIASKGYGKVKITFWLGSDTFKIDSILFNENPLGTIDTDNLLRSVFGNQAKSSSNEHAITSNNVNTTSATTNNSVANNATSTSTVVIPEENIEVKDLSQFMGEKDLSRVFKALGEPDNKNEPPDLEKFQYSFGNITINGTFSNGIYAIKINDDIKYKLYGLSNGMLISEAIDKLGRPVAESDTYSIKYIAYNMENNKYRLVAYFDSDKKITGLGAFDQKQFYDLDVKGSYEVGSDISMFIGMPTDIKTLTDSGFENGGESAYIANCTDYSTEELMYVIDATSTIRGIILFGENPNNIFGIKYHSNINDAITTLGNPTNVEDSEDDTKIYTFTHENTTLYLSVDSENTIFCIEAISENI